MRKIYFFIGSVLLGLFFVFEVFSQNTGLKINGTLDGWKLYTGLYTPVRMQTEDGVSYDYQYKWTEVTEAQARADERILLSGDMGSVDPIIACSGFLVNPDDEIVIQIGKNSGYADGRNNASANAERMTYSFVVNEESTLFTYKYACVLHVPTSDNHTSYQMPSFSVSVELLSPNGDKVTLPCESFNGGASFNSSTLLRNPSSCYEAKVERTQAPEEYVYQPWKTVSYDLTPYIGYTVNIALQVNDCLVDVGNRQQAGSHKAYGYFWGKTEQFRLIPRNCGNDDAYITAPMGFERYEWYRCNDNLPLETNANSPHEVRIPYSEIVDGARYCCRMIGSDAACTNLLADTVLNTIEMNPSFESKSACDLAVKFESTSTIERDTIKAYWWDFGDGLTSAAESPTHIYSAPGSYLVTLKITSGNGCTETVSRTVQVNDLPLITVDGDQQVCYGDPISLSVLSSGIGNEFYWLNQDGDTISKDISLSTRGEQSQYYKVVIVDKFSCEYSKDVYVTVSASPTIFIKGDTAACFNTPAKLWVWGDADSYVWNTGHVGDTLHIIPQQTLEYEVTGTYTQTGCKTAKKVKVVVNPLPEIKVIGPPAICSGETATLLAEGGEEYLWQNVFMGDSFMIAPVSSAVYEVLGTDSNGCSNQAQYKLLVNNKPELILHGNQKICEGEQLSLWVEGAQTYKWDDGTLKSAVTRVPDLLTTSYWVEGTSNGCVTKLEIPIDVNPNPTVSIQGKQDICEGDSVSLFAIGAATYEWGTGETQSQINKVLERGQTFYVTGTSEAGCKGNDSYVVNVHPKPKFKIDAPSAVCEDSEVTLKAEGVEFECVFQWDNGFVGSQITTFISDTTQFEVIAKESSFGCSSVQSHTIATIPYPQLTYQGKTKVCRGTAVSLSVSGAYSYKWSNDNTSNNFVESLEKSTSIWVEGTTNGCTSRLDIPINIIDAPYVWIDGKTNICVGDSLILLAHGADEYTWNASIHGETFKSFPMNSSTITLTGFNSDGCSTSLTIPYTVKPRPIVGIDGPTTVCKNTTATFSVSGDNLIQYVWSSGEMSQSVSKVVQDTLLLEVKAWDVYGCINTKEHRVSTVDPPVVSFTGETTVCLGDELDLVASGASNYTWEKDGEILSQSGRLKYEPQGNIRITLVGGYGDCKDYKDIYVYTLPKPNINIVGDLYVCKDDSFTLVAMGADFYEWSTGDTSSTIHYSLASDANYTVIGKLLNGCSAKKDTFVKVYPDFNVSLEEVGKDGCPGLLTTVALKASGAHTYTWYSEPKISGFDGSSGGIVEPLISERTEFFVIGKNEYGCLESDSIIIDPKDYDSLNFSVKPAIIEEEDRRVHFMGYTPKGCTWHWYPGDGEREIVGNEVSYEYSEYDATTTDSFLVEVKAVDDLGCEYTGSSYVYVWKDFWAPNAFSPNGDGLNDVFKFCGGEFMENFTYIIYNRLGQVLFEGKSIDDVWNGKYPDGQYCPQGVYGWVVNYSSTFKGIYKEAEKKGYVTIIK